MGIKFFLLRHGQTVWNEEGRYQGGRDIDLSPAGVRQGELAAEYLSNVNFSNIYSSPMKRAMDTAAIIRKERNLELKLIDNLKELNFGEWEGLRFNEINEKYHNDYKKWIGDSYNNAPPGGESFKIVQGRAVVGINSIIKENKDGSSVAVVTHGGVIVSLLAYWLQLPLERWHSIVQRQGAINIVVIDGNFPYIAAINYTGHLANVYNEKEDRIIEIYSNLRSKN